MANVLIKGQQTKFYGSLIDGEPGERTKLNTFSSVIKKYTSLFLRSIDTTRLILLSGDYTTNQFKKE